MCFQIQMTHKITYLILTVLMALLSVACGNQEQKPDADTLYAEASALYQQGNASMAKLMLDSIHRNFPRRVDVRTKAKALMYTIERDEETRNLAYYDSLYAILEQEWNSASKNFILSKDSAWYDYKLYLPRLQANARPRVGLLCEIKDNGELTIVSVFTGRVLNHSSFRVYNKDVFVQTDTVPSDSPYNNCFDDFGTRWEYVSFRPEWQNQVAEFIAANADQRLKVVLQGNKSTYAFYLEKGDRQVIKQSVAFADLTKAFSQVSKDRKKTADRLDWLNLHLQP